MIDVTDRDGVVVVTMDRPPVNAFDAALFRRLAEVFTDLAGDRRAVVVTATGSSFSAGVDLRSVIGGSASEALELLTAMRGGFLALFRHPAPVVAAINGHAIAGGCIIACAADRRLMAAGRGRIGVSEVRVGVPFPAAAFEIARYALGPRLGDLALTGRLLSGDEALAIGLVDAVVEPEALLDDALDEARRLAEIPLAVYAYTKRQLHRPAEALIAQTAAEDEAWVDSTWADEATREGIAAFLQRTVTR